MHVPPCLNLKFNVTTTDITICRRCFHVITSVWGKSRFEQPAIYLHMCLRDEEGDCQGYFGQRPLFGAYVCVMVCCLTLGFDILIVVVLSPRWIWAIPAPASPLIPAPPDQHCKCHLFKCKCCVLCFRPGTYAPARVPLGMRLSQSFFPVSTSLILFVDAGDITIWSPHKHTWAKFTAASLEDYKKEDLDWKRWCYGSYES